MRIIKGLAAIIALLLIIVGIPAVLISLVGNPLPGLAKLPELLHRPDYGGTILLGSVLPAAAWIVWAWMTLGFIAEALSALTSLKLPKLGFLTPARGMSSTLIGAILAMGVGLGAAGPATAAPNHALPINPTHTTSQSTAAATSTQTTPHTDGERVTVKAGESLWELAERHLGDGAKFKAIAELNYGVVQGDGQALKRDNIIQPGWVLRLPAGAAVSTPEVYTVKVGESLAGIAQHLLGDEALYPRLLALNPQIKDPDVIEVGQKLRIPQTTHRSAPAPAPKAERPAGGAVTGKEVKPGPQVKVPEAGTLAAPQTLAPEPVPAPSSAVPEAGAAEAGTQSVEEGPDDSTGGFLSVGAIATVGGIGGVLAAGLLSVLGLRRWNQRRHRRAGSKPVVVSEKGREVERRLREVAEPLTVQQIDQTLRYLAAWSAQHSQDLPELFCVRADKDAADFTLYLAEAADLPLPFVKVTDDRTVWQVDPRDLEEPTGPIPPPPYPALTTMGQDENNAKIMLNLEHLGSMGVLGERARCQQVMNALAVELGVSPWAEMLQVSLVGMLPDLPEALGTGRVRHFDDLDGLLQLLEGRAASWRAELAEVGAESVAAARVQEAAEAWSPEIVLISGDPSQEQLERLHALTLQIPRLGVAAIIEGDTEVEWSLTLLGRDGVLAPVQMPLRPQLLSDEESAAVIELLRSSSQERTEPGEQEIPQELEPVAAISLAPDASAQEAPEPAEEPAQQVEEATAPVPLVEPAAAPAEPTVPVEESLEEAEDLTGILEPLDTQGGAAPVIRLLGEVDVLGAAGTPPMSTATGKPSLPTQARCEALLAYIVLHPGASSEQVHEAFWPNADPSGSTAAANRNKLTSLTRKYLGEDAQGVSYMPHAAGGYRFDERVSSDWGCFLELVGPNPTKASTTRLVTALRLVRGAPFEGVKVKNYCWNDEDKSTMIDLICDTAHVLMSRALAKKDTEAAQLAARVGRLVDPANEQVWRNSMLAEHLAGNTHGIKETYRKLVDYLDSFNEDYEPEEETEQLYQDLSHGRRVAS